MEEKSQEQRIEIKMSTQLVQEILNYLQTKPYIEVFQLISKIISTSK